LNAARAARRTSLISNTQRSSRVPKTFPIRLEVEEFALGAVLRRLHEMQGIAKLDLDLGTGGSKPATKGNGHGAQEQVVAALMDGPKHRDELSQIVGGSRTRIYGALHLLKGKRRIKALGRGTYGLTAKPLALPAPVMAKRGPKGRVIKNESQRALALSLTGGPLRPFQIAEFLANHGVSGKSLSGVLARGKRDGLIRKQGFAYVLTAKGREIAHG